MMMIVMMRDRWSVARVSDMCIGAEPAQQAIPASEPQGAWDQRQQGERGIRANNNQKTTNAMYVAVWNKRETSAMNRRSKVRSRGYCAGQPG